MILDARHLRERDKMRELTPKEIEQLEESMHHLGFENYLLFVNTYGGETFCHPKGDYDKLQRTLAGFCMRSPELLHFLLEAIRIAVGARGVEIVVDGSNKAVEVVN